MADHKSFTGMTLSIPGMGLGALTPSACQSFDDERLPGVVHLGGWVQQPDLAGALLGALGDQRLQTARP